MMEEIKSALEYALMLLKSQADKGMYPESALTENGGEGFAPITNAIECISGMNVTDVIDKDLINKRVKFKGELYYVYNVMLLLSPEEDGSFKDICYKELRNDED